MKKISPVATKAVPLRMFKLLSEKLNEVIYRGNDLVEQVESLKSKRKSSKKKGKTMKKLGVLILAVLLTCQTVFGQASTSNLDRVSDVDMKSAILRAGLTVADFQGGGLISSGTPYYVDSVNGASNRSGKSWILSVDGIDTAINLISAAITAGTEKGRPIIYVRENHNESLVAASLIDADVAGITIIGLGRGAMKPRLDYDGIAGKFSIGAANVTLVNLRFVASSNAVSTAIDIEDAGDYASIIDCEFGWAEEPDDGQGRADEFATAIKINAGANYSLIEGCTFKSISGAAVRAILFEAVSGATIKNNTIYGDYSTACIHNTESADEIYISYNTLIQGNLAGDGDINTVAAISLANSTCAFINDNRIVSDVATALLMRVADDCIFMNNFVSDTDGDEFTGTNEAGYFYETSTILSSFTSVSPHKDG